MQAIIDAAESGMLPATIVGCLSDRDTAGALDRAARHDIPTAVLDPKTYDTTEAFGEAMRATLSTWAPSLVALAGYLKKVPAAVLKAYPERITNIHPSLLPAFGGKGMYGSRVHEAVLDYGVHWTGVTVHLVDAAYDSGPIVAQRPVPVRPDDTVNTLQERVLQVEHQLYPAVLRAFALGAVDIEKRTVTLQNDFSLSSS